MFQYKSNKPRTTVWIWLVLVFAAWSGFYGCSRKSEDIPTVPETVNGLISQGWEAFQNGDYEAAVANFEATLARNVTPELSIDAYRGLGWTYSRLEKYALAVTNFNFVISLESVSSKRFPVTSKSGVIAVATNDSWLPDWNGDWQLKTDDLIVKIDDIESYSARQNQKLGAAPAFEIASGTREINLAKAEISNAAKNSIGDALDNSMSFYPDSLTNAVASVDDLENLGDFYLDTQKGVVYIVPRINKLIEWSANYTYHEKGYLVSSSNFQTIVLSGLLESLAKTPEDEEGDVYYVKGDFYNRYNADDPSTGGTYLQADAYAGIACAYLAQGDYESALQAVKALAYINQDLKTIDPAHYPYKRTLFNGDDTMDMWDFYKVMALCYFNIGDYLNAEICLEDYLVGQDVVDRDVTEFAYDLLTAINELSDTPPADWTPIDIF